MTSKKRKKPIHINEIKNFLSPNCQPVRLEGDAIPNVFKNLVAKKQCYVFASGIEDFTSGTYNSNHNGNRIGGIEIYRDATMDPESYLYNVDGYSIITDTTTGLKLSIIGPSKTVNHWTNKIASGLTGVGVQYYKFPKCPHCGALISRLDKCMSCGWYR